ncbi:MAG TPA: enoyl-CoA hydratase-related protein, partial [Acidimicrobiia bacterium]|nr:enoyl-CoA hydratase-related protein [Acidimicrobiia bacterium]
MTLDYQTLQIDRQPSGITEVVLNNPDRLNSVDVVGHRELTQVWLDLDADPATKVILLRAEGRAFSAGGDFTLIEAMMNDPEVHRRT